MPYKHIVVVGCVLVHAGEVLCAQRSQQSSLPGLWEFPGGKVEQDESHRTALTREIQEELGCLVEPTNLITTTQHEYEFAHVNFNSYYCNLVDGYPMASEHQQLAWLNPDALLEVEWAPADIPTVHQVIRDLQP